MSRFLVLLCFLISGSVNAALTPTAESLRRISTIVESSELYETLGSVQWVSSISETANGIYTVTAASCSVNVTIESVVSNPPKMVSDLKVTVDKSTLVCLP